MEKRALTSIVLLSLAPSLAFAATAEANGKTTTTSTEAKASTLSKEQEVSYAIGVNVGENIRQQEVPVNIEFFEKGFRDTIAQKTPLLNTEQVRQVLSAFQDEQQKKFEQKMKIAAEKNLKEGKAFLEANKSKPGVITLTSGLQYKVEAPGEGESPQKTDTVTVNYRGTLIDGTEFDSSAKQGQPATFPVNAVIPGWTEALQLMKPGAKWTLYIPPNLAYGEAGVGRIIEPNSTLVFDVELLSVNKGDGAKPAGQ